jgi:hypothetical protein
MIYLAVITLAELAQILTILAAMLTGFYAILKFVLNNAAKATEADRDERKELTQAVNRMAKASEAQAKETRNAAVQAEKRNGHLAELQIEARADVLQAISKMGTQNVNEQVVKHQTVEEKEKK